MVVVVVVVAVVVVVVVVDDDDDDDVDDDVILLFIIVDVFVADHGIKFHVVLKLFKGLLQILKVINPVSASASRGISWTRHGTADLAPARK